MPYIDVTAIDDAAFLKSYEVFASTSLGNYTEQEQRAGLVLGYLPAGIFIREIKIIGKYGTDIYWTNKAEVKFNGVNGDTVVNRYLGEEQTIEFKGYLGSQYTDIFVTIRYFSLLRNNGRALATPQVAIASDGTHAIRIRS